METPPIPTVPVEPNFFDNFKKLVVVFSVNEGDGEREVKLTSVEDPITINDIKKIINEYMGMICENPTVIFRTYSTENIVKIQKYDTMGNPREPYTETEYVGRKNFDPEEFLNSLLGPEYYGLLCEKYECMRDYEY